jgi:L-ascorbate metabolism protein UlaG (beta-lactamase superfamily)
MPAPSYTQEKPPVDEILTSIGRVNMHFIGHGSLMFDINGFCIYIDPVRTSGSYKNLPRAGLILVTHEHYDHLDPELIEDLRSGGTVLLCNERAASKVSWARITRAGDKNVVNGITVEAVPAYNIVNTRSPGKPYHPRGEGVGYIINIGDTRFYVAGDTENTPEMKALKDVDVAFLPMNLPYTMTPEMVADAARAFKPKILYPYHFGDTDTDQLVELLKDTGIIVRVRDLK